MSKEDLSTWVIVLIIAVFCVDSLDNFYSESEIVEKGAAYYHPQTGKFTWFSNINVDKE